MKITTIILSFALLFSIFSASLSKLILATPVIKIAIQYSQIITIILFSILIIIFILTKKTKLNLKLTKISLFIFQLSLSLIYLYKEFYLEFLALISFSLVLFFFFSIKHNKEELLKSIYYAGIIYLVTTFIQSLLSLNLLILGNRFSGISQNPQATAITLALLIPIFLYHYLNSKSKKYSLLPLSITIISIILLVFTGSRTGILMTLIACLFLVKTKSKTPLKIILPILLLFTIIILLNPFDIDTQRLTSAQDTRLVEWNLMFNQFKTYPITGSPLKQGPTENSYLLSGAWFGFIPFTLLFLSTFIILINCLKSKNNFARFSILAILIGALFEGYLTAIVSFQIILLYLYISILNQ